MLGLNSKPKYLSLILRHKPEKVGLTLDEHGWMSVKDLISTREFSMKELEDIISYDSKGRYEFNEDKTNIRACQGHSVKNIDLELVAVRPPNVLYHGTKKDILEKIKKEGLLPMNRQYVHLSTNMDVAEDVANRRKGKNIILTIDSAKMHVEGYKFYKSNNGVWLSAEIPSKYFSVWSF